MDARFDLRRAYWLVAGIGGVNANEASIGPAAWAEWIVDGDLGFEIDAREIPDNWPTGFIPLGKAHPNEGRRSTSTARTSSITSIPGSFPGLTA